MPDPMEYDNEKDWMAACVPMHMNEGKPQDQAVAICMNMWTTKNDAAKWRMLTLAVKAVGDWLVDITAVPFGVDSDKQTFDAGTDYMLDTFGSPAIIYHHGIQPGAQNIEQKPIVIGKAVGVEARSDGIHVMALLDKTLEYAKRVWESAKQGKAVASSDSIAHLARLEVNGKRIMYEKNRPGRIAVWPLAGVSLWDLKEGNFQPASSQAIALPAMKAIYRDAGILFPNLDTTGAQPEAEKKAAKRAEIISQSKKILKRKA